MAGVQDDHHVLGVIDLTQRSPVAAQADSGDSGQLPAGWLAHLPWIIQEGSGELWYSPEGRLACVTPLRAVGPPVVPGRVVVAGEDLARSGFGSRRGRGAARDELGFGRGRWGVAGLAHVFHRQGDERGGDG